MQKVPGVTSVKVSLNEGLTVLDFAPKNTVTLAQLRQIIRNNGFTTRDAKISAAGSLSLSNNVTTFEVSGSGERLPVAGSVHRTGNVVVTGNVDTRDPKQFKITVTEVTGQ